MTNHQADGSELFKLPAKKESDAGGLSGTIDHIKEAGATLWHEAYENRTSLEIAGGVAIAAAALYAGRKQIFGRLAAAGAKDVLLVEDTPFMGKAFKSSLEANGERVTWVTGFKEAKPLTGTTLDGRDLVLDPKKIKVAFVDGDLKGSAMQGEQVVHALHDAGLPTIGTSTIPELNTAMQAEGAEIAAPKGTVLSALTSHKLDVGEAVRHPQDVQRGLDALTTQLKGKEGAPLRKEADALLQKYIAEDLL